MLLWVSKTTATLSACHAAIKRHITGLSDCHEVVLVLGGAVEAVTPVDLHTLASVQLQHLLGEDVHWKVERKKSGKIISKIPSSETTFRIIAAAAVLFNGGNKI